MSETSADERASWRDQSGHERNWLVRLLNDFNAQRARIAELEAKLRQYEADLEDPTLSVGEAYAYRSEDHGRGKKGA